MSLRNRLGVLAFAALPALFWVLRHERARASAIPPLAAAVKEKPKKAPLMIAAAEKVPANSALAPEAARKAAPGARLRERGEAFGGDRTEAAAAGSGKVAGASDQ